MKKILTVLVFVVFALACNAQTQHMKFKGIPMEGTLRSFVEKLKAKGYTYLGTEDGMATLNGEFAGAKGCTVVVESFPDRDQVSQVIVMFPEEKTWNGVYGLYSFYKDRLTEKYGAPDAVERFADGEPSDDFSKFYKLTSDECHYMSTFMTDNGKIMLTMFGSGMEACVAISYVDEANAEETRSRVMEDL